METCNKNIKEGDEVAKIMCNLYTAKESVMYRKITLSGEINTPTVDNEFDGYRFLIEKVTNKQVFIDIPSRSAVKRTNRCDFGKIVKSSCGTYLVAFVKNDKGHIEEVKREMVGIVHQSLITTIETLEKTLKGLTSHLQKFEIMENE